MPDAVETMAYAGQTPWHGLGQKVDDNLTPAEMLMAAQLDWTVSKRRVHVQSANSTDMLTTDDYFMLVRDSDDQVLGPAGKSYVPVQNAEVFEFFDKFVRAGDMTLETAGSLNGGRQVWGLANIRKGFTLPGGDEVQGHLLIAHPHIWGKAMTIMFTPIRVVCNNTLVAALGGAGDRFRFPHVKAWDGDVMEAAEQALGLASNQLDDFRQQAEILTKTEYTEKQLNAYLARIFNPVAIKDANKNLQYSPSEWEFDRTQFNRTMDNVFTCIRTQPGAELSEGTWWSALNAVTYYVDHKAGRDRDSSLQAAWFGGRAVTKRAALQLAMEYAA